MQLGMPTLIETETLADCAALCNKLGLDFIELNMNLPQYQPGEMDVQQCLALAQRYGISYTIHLDENLNVSDFNPHVARAYTQTVMETITLAQKLSAPVINMHLARGVYFTLPQKRVYLYDVYRERYLRSMEAFRDACTRAVGDSGITIGVENCDGFTPVQREGLSILLKSPVFGLTFDVGHDHACGGADKPFILANREKLRHMHLHDAMGSKNHLALGTGEMDILACLQLARAQNCCVVLETKTIEGLCQSVTWLHENMI